MPLADYAHPPEFIRGRRETRLPDGSQIIFVPGSPLPWRAINSMGVKVDDYSSESLAQSALNDQILTAPETPKRAKCSHCRSGYHTADDCPVKATEGERISAARKAKDMATSTNQQPTNPTDAEYLSAVQRMDAGIGVRVVDVDRVFDNIITTRSALDRLVDSGKLTRTRTGHKAARYRVCIRPEIIRAMFTSDDSDPTDVPAPDGSRVLVAEPGLLCECGAYGDEPCRHGCVVAADIDESMRRSMDENQPPTPPEILDPDVLRPEEPTECAAKPIKPITKNRDTALGRELWDEVEEASRECRERSLRKPWTATLDHPAGGTATSSGEEPAECAAEEDAPYVCPGCYAVGEEPCAPGCIDAEIEAERQYAMEEGNWDTESDDDPDDPDPWDSWLPDVRQSAADVSTTPVALTPIKAQQIIRREQRLRSTRDERAAELREAVRVLRALADVGEGLIVEVDQ